MWLRCVDERVDHAVDRDGPDKPAGFVVAVCQAWVYPLEVASNPRRRCGRCVAELGERDQAPDGGCDRVGDLP